MSRHVEVSYCYYKTYPFKATYKQMNFKALDCRLKATSAFLHVHYHETQFFMNITNGNQKEGKTKGQALICIMRRLVNMIYGMMKNKTAYKLPIIKERSSLIRF